MTDAPESEFRDPTTAPLDELMLAMDVVDTLRHERRMLERELGSADRDRQLIERLREIYAGQGIAVADEVLAQGVRALQEGRFAYKPPKPGLRRSLQIAYVSRGPWGKILLAIAAVSTAAAAAIVLT